MTNPNEIQVGGDHYKNSAVQHWDIMTYYGPDWFVGNATKYVYRWRKKNGLQDLEKAAHYLDKLIEGVKLGLLVPNLAPRFTREKFNTFIRENDVTPMEASFLSDVFFWQGIFELDRAKATLGVLINEAKNPPEPVTDEA